MTIELSVTPVGFSSPTGLGRGGYLTPPRHFLEAL